MKNFIEKLKHLGPGIIVVAGFIGPGTVTTCTVSGASFGYTLLWAMLFSTIATIVLQEMSARLGIVSRMGLGQALREKYQKPISRLLLATLVISAIFIGNIAYETGNVSGALLGIGTITPGLPKEIVAIVIGIISFLLLYSGSYKKVEKVMIFLVLAMSGLFLVTAIAVKPNMVEVLKGLFVPQVPEMERSWMYIAGLVGTTVVPYNIYLHASTASQKWGDASDLHYSRWDTVLSIGLGGIVSMCIIIAASAAFYGTGITVTSGADMAKQLEPILGSWASIAMGLGLFAASITSTITAPLSAAFATSGILGWGEDMAKPRFKLLWATVLIFGIVAVCTIGSTPTEIILFAQAANALLLPISTVALILACNDKKIMGNYRNKLTSNLLGVLVLLVTVFIAFRNITNFAESFVNLLS